VSRNGPLTRAYGLKLPAAHRRAQRDEPSRFVVKVGLRSPT
jgi:hypothetical protein